MKKVFLLATAALMVTGMAFAEGGKKKNKKKCAKSKTCCTKDASAKKGGCCKDKAEKAETTATM
jgi:hypothetical protein